MTQRTGGSIPRIGKRRLPCGFLRSIQLFEAFFRHIHLAPYNKAGRRRLQSHGNRSNGFQVFRYILAHIAIPTSRTPNKSTVLIFQRHGKAVNFRFHRKRNVRSIPRLFQKIRQLFHAENILQAHQGNRMYNLLKFAECLSPNPAGWGIRAGKLRIGLFQLFQLTHKPVIFKVWHVWIVQHIISVICILQKGCQLFNSLFRFHVILLFVKKYPEPRPQSRFLPPRPHCLP